MIIQPDKLFIVGYPTYDHQGGLIAGTTLYEVSTGNPVLLEQFPLVDIGDGLYAKGKSPTLNQSYLALSAIYTDADLAEAHLDPDRQIGTEIYDCISGAYQTLNFAYGAVDKNPDLNIQAEILDITTGTAVAVATVIMPHVAMGVYFGQWLGELGKTYEVVKRVYTDDTFAVIDDDWAPSVDQFQTYLSQSGGSGTVISIMSGQPNQTLVSSFLKNATTIQSSINNQGFLSSQIGKQGELASGQPNGLGLKSHLKNATKLASQLNNQTEIRGKIIANRSC